MINFTRGVDRPTRMIFYAALAIAAAHATASAGETTVWRDVMPGSPRGPSGIMASVDVEEWRGPADAIRVRRAGETWESPLRFTYHVYSTMPAGKRAARYHATAKGSPEWPVGDRVRVSVRVAGSWVDFGEVAIRATD